MFKKGDLVLISEDGLKWDMAKFLEHTEDMKKGIFYIETKSGFIIAIYFFKYCIPYPDLEFEYGEEEVEINNIYYKFLEKNKLK